MKIKEKASQNPLNLNQSQLPPIRANSQPGPSDVGDAWPVRWVCSAAPSLSEQEDHASPLQAVTMGLLGLCVARCGRPEVHAGAVHVARLDKVSGERVGMRLPEPTWPRSAVQS